MQIGIGISTRNRPEVLAKTLEKINQYRPENSVLVVVDDASDMPVKSDYRFNERAGIARVKNKCLELLIDAGCDQLFLLDDDVYPKKEDWWKPYIEHPEPHLMYIFTSYGGQKRVVNEIYRDDKTVAYDHVRGCFLYFDKKCIDTVGGFDPAFGYGYYEHRDLTQRIHNAGLTTHLIMDIPNSGELIHSMDENQEIQSTFTHREHDELLAKNRQIKNERAKISYKDYR